MQPSHKSIDLDDLAAEAVRLGRELANMARDLSLGERALDASFVSRCLARLRDRVPFDPRDEGGLAAVGAMLERDLAGEIVGTERRFVETRYDEHGPDGEVRDVPVFSDRGQQLVHLQETFRRFSETRHAVLDRLAAHRALMAMMSG